MTQEVQANHQAGPLQPSGPDASGQRAQPSEEAKSPAAAAWLSLVPGLGLVYLGLYVQGLAVLALIFSVASLDVPDDVLTPLSLSLYAFQIVFAYREAKRLNLASVGKALPPLLDLERQSPVWGYVLLAVGVLLLFNNFFLAGLLGWLIRLWPILLIIIGVRLIRRSEDSASSGT